MFSGLDRFGTVVTTLLMTTIIGRLLRPDEIGVILIGSGLLQVLTSIREFGASAFIAQHPQLSRDSVRTTFTFMVIISLLLAAAVCALAPFFARFYGEPRLDLVLRVGSAGLVLAVFGNAPIALMQRDLEFKGVAITNISGAVVNFLFSLVLVLSGFGFMSLVWANIASIATMVATAIYLRPEFWVYRPCIRQWRGVPLFASYSSTTATLASLAGMLPQLAIGRALGFADVGIYSRAMMLCSLPERMIFSAFTPVLLPALAARSRDGYDIKADYLRALSMVSIVQLPVICCVILLAEPLVALILGSQWFSAVPLVRIIGFSSLILFPASLTYPTLVATGRIQDTFTIAAVCMPLTTCLSILASFQSLAAVAEVTLLVAPVQLGLSLWLLRRSIAFHWSEFAWALRDSLTATLFSIAAPIVTIAYTWPHVGSASGLAAAIGALVGWVIALKLTEHPLIRLMERMSVPSPGRLPFWRLVTENHSRKRAATVHPSLPIIDDADRIRIVTDDQPPAYPVGPPLNHLLSANGTPVPSSAD